jgi:hypothetical protein
MRFLLQQQWLPGRSLPRSPVDLVRSIWGDSATIPDIQCRVFGYPEGAVRIGTDDRIVRAVLVPANAPAVDWLNRHGTPALVEVLHRLPVPFPAPTRLNAGGELFRLSSVEQYARESFSGFLEPRDVILLDPSYQPLLALGTLIHEWQHILHERARQREPAAGTFRPQGDQLRVTQLDPFLAEGLAEWLTEEMLAPVNLQFPLLLFGEAEKRASLSNDDPHQLGYIMVQSLARALGDPRATLDLLVRSGNDPALILADRRVSRAWSRYSAPDRLLQRRGDRVLLPQVVFTIEDNHPDLVESDILTPTD